MLLIPYESGMYMYYFIIFSQSQQNNLVTAATTTHAHSEGLLQSVSHCCEEPDNSSKPLSVLAVQGIQMDLQILYNSIIKAEVADASTNSSSVSEEPNSCSRSWITALLSFFVLFFFFLQLQLMAASAFFVRCSIMGMILLYYQLWVLCPNGHSFYFRGFHHYPEDQRKDGVFIWPHWYNWWVSTLFRVLTVDRDFWSHTEFAFLQNWTTV